MPMRRRGSGAAACAGCGRAVLEHRDLPHRLAQVTDPRSDRRRLPGLAGQRRLRAYRTFKKRQRCLAHLIRKGIALADTSTPQALARGVAAARGARPDPRGRQGHQRAHRRSDARPPEAGLQNAPATTRPRRSGRSPASPERLTAITAFVTDPDLPATNDEAERALRDAVIARHLQRHPHQGGLGGLRRHHERPGTCRRRGVEPWRYITDLLARATKGCPTSRSRFQPDAGR